jgi:hypothetical protein
VKNRPRKPEAYYREIRRRNSYSWRTRNPEKHAQGLFWSSIKRKYGITRDQYEALLCHQGGVCAICRQTCVTGFRLGVDHDHKTGKVRGLLCSKCNRGIGNLGDDVVRLRLAVQYLEMYK